MVFQDRITRNQPIVKSLINMKTDSFLTLENRSKKIKILTAMSNQAIQGISTNMTTHTEVVETIQPPFKADSHILSMALNEEDQLIALTTTE